MASHATDTWIHRNRRKGRGHGALCAIQHLRVVGEPGGSGRGEGVRGAINNRAPHRSPHSRHRRAQVSQSTKGNASEPYMLNTYSRIRVTQPHEYEDHIPPGSTKYHIEASIFKI